MEISTYLDKLLSRNYLRFIISVSLVLCNDKFRKDPTYNAERSLLNEDTRWFHHETARALRHGWPDKRAHDLVRISANLVTEIRKELQ